jgi:molybdate transport system ATP-binding protein
LSRLDVHFESRRGGFTLDCAFKSVEPRVTAICGASGSGKTTLLRCIAGLDRAQAGHLIIDDESWFDSQRSLWRAAHRRPVAYVTQSSDLFAHLDVSANLNYGWKRLQARARRLRFDDVVDGLRLQPLLRRRVGNLSGGEHQRVSIGRALLRSPQLLLLDEPVSALDTASRADVLGYLQQVLNTFDVRCLYVSHDLREAARLGNEMLWLENGRIVAQGRTIDVLTDVRLPFADRDDAESVLFAQVIQHEESTSLTQVQCSGGVLWLPNVSAKVGERIRIQIAARDVSLALAAPGEISILNRLQGTVMDVRNSHHPAQALVRLKLPDAFLLARVTRKSVAALHLKAGDAVWALVKSVALLDDSTAQPASSVGDLQ